MVERTNRMSAPLPHGILRQIAVIRVASRAGERTRGWLRAGPLQLPVALGRSWIAANKREGDGATPRGTFRLVRLWWRADRLSHPCTLLPSRRIGPYDAWVEDPADRRYNSPVTRKTKEIGDRLWRTDHLYDLIIELDHNTRPRVAGRGSAVFVHVARPGFGPTAGCVALDRARLRGLLSRLGPKTRIKIQ
jgi:L,D-peptidoglycan transpeptidase YkuD (ErfK/YbiS/YcfS/YnhG family)